MAEGFGPGRSSSANIDVIGFDLSDENAILDDTVHWAEPQTEEREVVPNVSEIFYDQTESEPLTEVNPDDPRYFPIARRIEQITAGVPPDRLTCGEMYTETELKDESKIPKSYGTAAASNNREVRQKAMEKKDDYPGQDRNVKHGKAPSRKKFCENERGFWYKAQRRKCRCTPESPAGGNRTYSRRRNCFLKGLLTCRFQDTLRYGSCYHYQWVRITKDRYFMWRTHL